MKVLVANRGEIAVRVLRACRDLGMPSVAVYSDADCDALHTRYADEALRIGPASARESYLSIGAILEAAKRSGAHAIHPGYGFLSEDSAFAEAVEGAGMVFVGPRPETLKVTGNKVAARRVAREAGLPVLSGPDSPWVGDASAITGLEFGYPLLVKAVSGGGGRGIRLVERAEDLATMVSAARREALSSFGDDGVYLEPLISGARHRGSDPGRWDGSRPAPWGAGVLDSEAAAKLIEEAPAPGLSDEQRRSLTEAAVRFARLLRYRSLGTVEFLLDGRGDFHFIEINPRIQVEHPVTELVTGIDLVKEQLRLATGRTLSLSQEQIELRGAAIEARVR